MSDFTVSFWCPKELCKRIIKALRAKGFSHVAFTSNGDLYINGKELTERPRIQIDLDKRTWEDNQ